MNVFSTGPAREALARAMREIMRQQFSELPERTVSWRPARVDRMIHDFSGREDGPHAGETRAWAALVSPQDFLESSSTATAVQRILGETGPLDLDRLSNLHTKSGDLETPYLGVINEHTVSPLGLNRDLRVVSHQGRHRTTALGRAGARQVPVILPIGGEFNRANVTQYGKLDMIPQRRLLRDRLLVDAAMGDGYANNLIPIRPENRDLLLSLGAQNKTPNHITYALPLLAALASLLRGGDEDAGA